MRTKLKLIAATAVAAGLLGLSAQAQEVVKIAHAGPTSGPAADYGRGPEAAVRMAIEDLNAQGVVIGGKKVRLELVTEDDAAAPVQATAIAQKLCDMKVNGVVGHLTSGTTIPAARIYNDCGIPHITYAATSPDLTKPAYNTTFRVVANDNQLGASIANLAADQLKIKTVAIVDDRTAYGQGVATVFRQAITAKGVKVVATEYTSDKATDFMAILTNIKARKPDAIFYGGLDGQAGPMLRQMEQLGMSGIKFLGGDAICTETLPGLAGGVSALNGVYCTVGGLTPNKLPQGFTDWANDFAKRFPNVFMAYGIFAYDATFILVDAMKRAGSTDPKIYVPFLKSTDFQGVIARYAFEANGEMKNPPSAAFHFQDGKRLPL